MPALKGSLTYARFFVDGEVPGGFHGRFLKAVRANSMRPLDPAEDVSERSGWCRMGEPFQVDISHDDIFYNEFINLGFRTDRWVIPGPMLRAKLRDAEASILARRGRERLSRKEKTELKDVVAKKLRRELSPATRSVDLSWSLTDGIVRFFSQALAPATAMSDLFTRTFGLKLVPESPYTLAARLGLKKQEEVGWRGLSVTLLGAEEESNHAPF